MKTLLDLVRTMRPGQWVKNLFVLAPAIFAKAHTEGHPEVFLAAFQAVAVFILLTGAVYVMNDVLDLEKDRNHPVKRNRPLASGALSIQTAVAGGLASLAGAYALGSILGPAFTLVVTAYLALNVAYSVSWKKVAYLDVLCIATGFLLRVLGGGYAIGLRTSEISIFIVLCTFLVALFLALGKRRHELAAFGEDGGTKRAVLEQYQLHHLDNVLWVVAGLTVAAYVLYTVSPQTVDYFGTWRLVFTIPFVVYGIIRFMQLLRRGHDPRSPTDVIIRDVPFVVNIAAWAAVAGWAVYG